MDQVKGALIKNSDLIQIFTIILGYARKNNTCLVRKFEEIYGNLDKKFELTVVDALEMSDELGIDVYKENKIP